MTPGSAAFHIKFEKVLGRVDDRLALYRSTVHVRAAGCDVTRLLTDVKWPTADATATAVGRRSPFVGDVLKGVVRDED